MSGTKTYLGDGLYAHHDGYNIVLTAPRLGGEHMVALEPPVVESFISYLEKTLGVVITITKKEPS